ncbi:hypothetical protein HZS_1933 [Henneguya salminicola]|nr:hypothetical protein HZS_1933 [Henneguya salminicola]
MEFDPSTAQNVPCVYLLLRGKKKSTGKCYINQQPWLEYSWMPKIIAAHFEKTVKTTVKRKYPKSRIIGCYFHLNRFILKN